MALLLVSGFKDIVVHSAACKSLPAALSMVVAGETGGGPVRVTETTVLTGIEGTKMCTFGINLTAPRNAAARGIVTAAAAHRVGTPHVLSLNAEAAARLRPHNEARWPRYRYGCPFIVHVLDLTSLIVIEGTCHGLRLSYQDEYYSQQRRCMRCRLPSFKSINHGSSLML